MPALPLEQDMMPSDQRIFKQDASIVLVGCRGAGKRSLGFIGALHLRRRLITEDHYFVSATGQTRAQFLTKHGKEAFTQRNAEVFKHMLDTNRKRCIIECGMSSLSEEAQDALREYCKTNPVIYIHREKEQLLRLLDPADAEALLKMDESHRSCSNFEYYNLYDPHSGKTNPGSEPSAISWDSAANPSRLLLAKEDFTHYLDLLTGQAWRKTWLESPFSINAVPPHFRQASYALRLRLSYLVGMDLEWEDLEASGDCVELIIDHWPEDMFNVIAKQVALIRRKLSMPVIYHVEETPREERVRSQEERDAMDLELLELGLRLNVDFLSLDLQRNPAITSRILAQKGRSKVIGNFWNFGMNAIPWSDEANVENYKLAQSLGCDVVRIVRFCSGDSANEKLVAFTEKIETTIPDPKPPLVAFDFSFLGVRTPLQTRILGPVKHRCMEGGRDHFATVCSSSVSFEQLFRDFRLFPLEFCTVGSNVSYSLTPAIYQAAFQFWSMPHTYQAVQCSQLDDLNRIFARATFGGACLAAPFKVAILPHLKLKSHHAAAIGAVNVVLPLRGKTSFILDHANSRNMGGVASEFYGDNTDWSAILTCLRRAISPRNFVVPTKTTGLVIGAGGMARSAVYALLQLGCRNIFIYNRTAANAQRIADHFNEWSVEQGLAAPPSAKIRAAAAEGAPPGSASALKICHTLGSIAEPWPRDYQPPTMIVSCVPAVSIDGSPPADFELPKQWLGSTTGGVVVELAYEPLITPLVAQMQVFRDTVSPAWVVVDGLDIVSEMAIESFELMTGRMAPKRLMKEVCRRAWEQQRRDMSSVS